MFLALVVSMVPASADSNGGVIGYVSQIAGPYEVRLGTIPATPVPGNLHFSIQVLKASNSQPVDTANLIVSGVGPSNTDLIKRSKAFPDPNYPSFYDIDLTVNSVGNWLFKIEINGSLGEVDTLYEIEVRSTNPLPGLITFGVLISFLVIIGLSVRSYLNQKNRR